MISTNSDLMSKIEILGIIMITTNRLTIRPIEENDWTAIKEIWDDFKNTEFVIYDNIRIHLRNHYNHELQNGKKLLEKAMRTCSLQRA